MRKFILSYSQKQLVELELSLDEALLLQYFVDFRNTDSMKEVIIDGNTYYWLLYKKVLEDLPILGIKTRRSVYNKFEKLVKAKVLEKKVHKITTGTRTYFKLGVNYQSLVRDKVDLERINKEKEKEKQEVDENTLILFNKFWEQYPRKDDKKRAMTSFENNVKNEETFNLVMKDLEKRKGYEQWETRKYIPLPSTYLNGNNWEDEYDTKDGGYNKANKGYESVLEAKD